MITYIEALDKIHQFYKFGTRLGLERVAELLEKLGNPQDKLEFIHVAGTNGKGSVSTMIANILMQKGKKIGLFTSPFVIEFRERMQINGEMIDKSEFAEITEKVFEIAEKMEDTPTEFELITAIAMVYFAREKCDAVVLEVGLGGRYDATNIIKKPLASVITSISFDHTEHLGETIAEIASNKAGIIKQGGITVVSCNQQQEALEVFRKKAEELDNTLIICENSSKFYNGKSFVYKDKLYELSMLGAHQVENAITAIETAKALGVDELSIQRGIKAAKLPARMELLCRKPPIILDGAHNIDAINRLCVNMRRFFSDKKIIVVMGMMKDKLWQESALEIEKIAYKIITTESSNPRAIACESLAQACGGTPIANPYDAIRAAIKEWDEDSLILICGSLYLAGDVRDFIKRLTK